ncbi:serine/threonine-protein kinase [Verrucomicrobium sp. BvORR106]|uniref:serine/threonine-protein kinase n=1 Tax=Verrucomicrobium sp. BvORR106 TaxID=1403819 RepID=UPI00056F260A|nr:serine/threonine-protein kinase [Verrucomicrobium sp. BvORR106]
MMPESLAQNALPEQPTTEAYVVQERVAIGTAGIVYRAIETATGQQVLFKLLSGETSNPMDPAWVLERAPVLKQIRHPHIATLLDAYDDPEGCVLVYAYQAGWAGNAFPSQRLLADADEAREVARQLCDAIMVGEKSGMPHGDLKPSNLIITDQGTAGLSLLVLDWGLSECRANPPVETLQFMAPERLMGGPATVSGDLFSLGATIWYLLTGKQPVEGKTREALLASWQQFDAASITSFRADVDPAFAQWLGWLLKLDARDRPGWVSQATEVLNRRAQASAPRPVAPRLVPPKPAGPAPGPPVDANAPTARLIATPTTHLATGGSPRFFSPDRLAGVFFFVCILAGAAVAFVWWAESKWGAEWPTELAKFWKAMWR